MLIPRALLLILPAAMCARTAYCQTWTDLSPVPGSQVFYVSSSSGADTNPGTEALPFRSLARGQTAVRQGHPDQLRLRCGDTWGESVNWAKASGSGSQPMIVAAYGVGPLPKLRTTGTAFYCGQRALTGLLVADLDMAPVAPASGSNGFAAYDGWSYLTLEGCLIAGFAVNVVEQEVGPGRLDHITIRNCVIVDSNEPGSAHSQGIFWGSVDNGVIEGCVLDLNAAAKQDIFCHNVYLHQTCGPSIFRANITARACSHGVQQRSGGVMENNLALGNPINLYQGDGSGVFNAFRWNVALDSRDINAGTPRGFAFWVNGAAGSDLRYNVAAHQDHGTANCVGIAFDGAQPAIAFGNVVYDWPCPTVDWGHGIEGPVSVWQGNTVYQPRGGECVYSFTGAASQNVYGSTTPARCYNGGAYPGEPGSTFTSTVPTFNARIGDYMSSIGKGGGLPEFMAEARKLSRFNDRPQFRAPSVNQWVRSIFGVPGPCYADQDFNGVLNVNDFQAFLTKFAAADLAANCDGSSVAPILNANDFQCFLNAYAVGCP